MASNFGRWLAAYDGENRDLRRLSRRFKRHCELSKIPPGSHRGWESTYRVMIGHDLQEPPLEMLLYVANQVYRGRVTATKDEVLRLGPDGEVRGDLTWMAKNR